MKCSKRVEMFEQVKARNERFLLSVLWKLTGDKEIFAEAMQYALLGIWQHVEKLNGRKAQSYIYRIALSANSKAWRNRVGRDGEIARNQIRIEKDPSQKTSDSELVTIVRRAISQLPTKQAKAIVMRYFQQQPYQTIAENLSCTEAGARSHVSKALASLKSKLEALA